MHEDRGDDRERDGRPQPVLPQLGGLAGRIGEVVQRADASHAEERGRPPLRPGHAAVVRALGPGGESKDPCDGADDQDERQADRDAAPVECLQQAARHGDAEDQQHEQRQQPLESLRHFVHRCVVVVRALRGAEGHRTHEDGQEPVAAEHLAHAVRRDERGQREQRLPSFGHAKGRAVGAERQVGQGPSDDDPGHHADEDLGDEVEPEPLQGPVRDGPLGGEQDGNVDERKGQAVVEPRLRGEGEAQLVRLVHLVVLTGLRSGDLDVGSQDGVGRRKRCPEDDGSRRRQAGHPAEHRDRHDGDGHRDEQQPPRSAPPSPACGGPELERTVQGQPHAHQRDEHDELGHVLDRGPVVLRVEGHAVRQRREPDQHAHRDEDHGR